MPLKLLHGSKKLLPSMKTLWRDTFGDSDEFIDLFFTKFYKPRKAFLRFDGDELVSMLFYMDLKVKFDGRSFKTAYLYGVATKLSERRQGHFTTLHNALLDELKEKKYDLIVTIPQNESLFSFYKDIGYTLPLRRCEYELETLNLERVEDLSQIWQKKKELHKKSRQSMSILESEELFIESRREHRFFSYDGGYLGFYPADGSYKLYDVISNDPLHAPLKLVHYERSALIMDLTGRLDGERIEKEKPVFSFLLN